MSKRTLDAFLVAPAAVGAKKAKRPPNAGTSSSSRDVSKRKAVGLEVIEVVDLDEVIDLSSPPPRSHDTLVDGKTGAKRKCGEVEVDGSMQSGSREEDKGPTPVLEPDNTTTPSLETHQSYPFPIPRLSPTISRAISGSPIKEPKVLNHLPHLDLLTFEPYLGPKDAREYGEFLRRELPFYRVEYKLTRFGKETDIKTPRFTTVFGVDETSRFAPDGILVETSTGKPIAKNKYKTAKPRPIPSCLDDLRKSVEAATGTVYNYALVNYYATGSDSISYHSDDEHFLEKEPAIASFSFLGVRDFLLKHKPPGQDKGKSKVTEEANDPAAIAEIAKAAGSPLKFALRPGTMILMRGTTQSNWLHSIPKRAGDGGGGRINITFRRNMTVGGTENYYRYNVGTGKVWKWNERKREMALFVGDSMEAGTSR